MSNPVALVVGAGPGVGSALARRYGAAGYDVGLVRRDARALEELGRSLQEEGITAGWCPADVADPASLTAAIERLAGAEVIRPLTARTRNQIWGTGDLLDELHDLGVRIGARSAELLAAPGGAGERSTALQAAAIREG